MFGGGVLGQSTLGAVGSVIPKDADQYGDAFSDVMNGMGDMDPSMGAMPLGQAAEPAPGQNIGTAYKVKGDGTDWPSQLSARYTGQTNRWKELCKANNLPLHPKYGCVYKRGQILQLPQEWVGAPAAPPPMQQAAMAPPMQTTVIPPNGNGAPAAAPRNGKGKNRMMGGVLIAAGVAGIGVIGYFVAREKGWI